MVLLTCPKEPFQNKTLNLVPVHPHLSRSDSVVMVLIAPLVLSPREREGGRERERERERWELGNHHITSVVYIHVYIIH